MPLYVHSELPESDRDVVLPLRPEGAHIDLAGLPPELMAELQNVVIACEDLLLHLNEVIGRGRDTCVSTRTTPRTVVHRLQCGCAAKVPQHRCKPPSHTF